VKRGRGASVKPIGCLAHVCERERVPVDIASSDRSITGMEGVTMRCRGREIITREARVIKEIGEKYDFQGSHG
jgi:hypothetical protein